MKNTPYNLNVHTQVNKATSAADGWRYRAACLRWGTPLVYAFTQPKYAALADAADAVADRLAAVSIESAPR